MSSMPLINYLIIFQIIFLFIIFHYKLLWLFYFHFKAIFVFSFNLYYFILQTKYFSISSPNIKEIISTKQI